MGTKLEPNHDANNDANNVLFIWIPHGLQSAAFYERNTNVPGLVQNQTRPRSGVVRASHVAFRISGLGPGHGEAR